MIDGPNGQDEDAPFAHSNLLPLENALDPIDVELVHVWSRCHACDAEPIKGRRFECNTCPPGPDNDLCERCYGGLDDHTVVHPKPGTFSALAGTASDQAHDFRSSTGRRRAECMPWLDVSVGEAATPNVDVSFVVRPEFCSKRESFIGSYAFVVDGPPLLLLTALHVLGSLIRAKGIDCSSTNASYSGRELPAAITTTNLFDPFAANWAATNLGSAGPMLPLPDARIGDEEPFSQRDVAAFVVDSRGIMSPGKLATGLPRIGEPIWLIAAPSALRAARTTEAVVVEATERTLIFRYKSGDRIQAHTSGAPLVNRNGEVVGINVGAGMLDGRRFGHAAHVSSIRHHLRGLLNGR